MAIWAIIPAAGIGTRMNSALPKQYLPLAGKSVLANTLDRLAQIPDLGATVVALHPEDRYWAQQGRAEHAGLITCSGGAERAQSVLNGLHALQGRAEADDWVLVHDAVRPCVRVQDILNLLATLARHPVGGLLATPVSSTLKRANDDAEIIATVPREAMWQASTPQAFPYGMLRAALEQALAQGVSVSDEAAAMERAGHRPRLVRGGADNIKITYPDDLLMAGIILQAQAQEVDAKGAIIRGV